MSARLRVAVTAARRDHDDLTASAESLGIGPSDWAAYVRDMLGPWGLYGRRTRAHTVALRRLAGLRSRRIRSSALAR